MKYCWILVGPPGCGKTTFIESIGRVAVDGYNYTIDRFGGGSMAVLLSSDRTIDIMAAARGETYAEAFADCVGEANKIFEDNLQLAFKAGKNVVVDRTSMSVKSRRKIFNKVPSDYKVVAIDLVTNLKAVDWIKRAMGRTDKTVPKHVMVDMMFNYEPPTIEEGFSSITRV